jgi:hypothetical protein
VVQAPPFDIDERRGVLGGRTGDGPTLIVEFADLSSVSPLLVLSCGRQFLLPGLGEADSCLLPGLGEDGSGPAEEERGLLLLLPGESLTEVSDGRLGSQLPNERRTDIPFLLEGDSNSWLEEVSPGWNIVVAVIEFLLEAR